MPPRPRKNTPETTQSRLTEKSVGPHENFHGKVADKQLGWVGRLLLLGALGLFWIFQRENMIPMRFRLPRVIRGVKEATTTPCRDEYEMKEIQSWVDTHLAAARQYRSANPVEDKPDMLLLLGGPGAGKGTLLRKWREGGGPRDAFALIGLDEFLQFVPEFNHSANDKYFVFEDAASPKCYKPAIKAAKLANTVAVAEGLNVIYEDTGKDITRLVERVIPPYKEAGYRITIVLVHNEPDIAIQRAFMRFLGDGRLADEQYIKKSFKNVDDNYYIVRNRPTIDEAVYCDNTCRFGRPFMSHTAAGSVPENCLRCKPDGGEERPVRLLESLLRITDPLP
ncbi:hypothetical protein Pmar_PMAR024464 [Perkinsus marinus ATCC 50983]|uniref:Zeta toxin domain-containing protein n=1 Tax=Perkinsus marinus (strain ATCC 50983 / TXsc) TaxID=423536 RepID=C5LT18_PERM5|nr:hypothetical protein Pmar_PMAR024464 [Perkinsus marinus ATCC 50983]EEQ99985.1 hypothetical protein Pmar_PMAR024464 [Perkinsus marinus ATCC 50983]|eukprot:XP_002767268.1 hypothetical protein Pmar_PMAR024464 [Perkinsus marinus ATCC 50983]